MDSPGINLDETPDCWYVNPLSRRHDDVTYDRKSD